MINVFWGCLAAAPPRQGGLGAGGRLAGWVGAWAGRFDEVGLEDLTAVGPEGSMTVGLEDLTAVGSEDSMTVGSEDSMTVGLGPEDWTAAGSEEPRPGGP